MLTIAMRLTMSEYLALEARHKIRQGKSDAPWDSKPVEREIPLHEEIIRYCNSQWPRWKYRHARTDKRTTEELGTEDFTLFLPNGITVHVECKARNEKQTPEQLAWEAEMRMLNHHVHVVRSMEEFLELVRV